MANSSKTSKKTVSTAKTWKSKASQGEDVELPSGNVCYMKRPGLPELLARGLMPDSLTGAAQRAIDAGKTGKKKKTQDEALRDFEAEALSDPRKRVELFDTFDRIAAFCVLKPELRFYKYEDPEDGPVGEIIPAEDRDEDVLYTDDVDFEDKVFIFYFVAGGTRDLEQFRREWTQSVDDVSTGKDVEVPA